MYYYLNIYIGEMLRFFFKVTAQESLEADTCRPEQFANAKPMSTFSKMDVKQFDEKYKVVTGRGGIMYIMNNDSMDSEVLFLLQGFIGNCLVVGPRIIHRYCRLLRFK